MPKEHVATACIDAGAAGGTAAAAGGFEKCTPKEEGARKWWRRPLLRSCRVQAGVQAPLYYGVSSARNNVNVGTAALASSDGKLMQ